jgi:plastocyanin
MPMLLLLSLGTLSPKGSASEGQPAGPKTYTVEIKGFKFIPEKLEVNAGDTVIWKNEDIVPHTATAPKGFDSKGIDPNKTWTYVATKKGAHLYICSYHPTMKGELDVK